MKSQQSFARSYSCEFFPPRTEQGWSNWRTTLAQLGELNPSYFSCTYGAGGTTQAGTYEAVKSISEAGFAAAPHITCIGSTRDKIRKLLADYQALGISRLVALRGDLPADQEEAGEFHYANELIEFIRQETGEHFHIEIAAYPETHPQAPDPWTDLHNFKLKALAGANAAITQYFFNADAYYRFVDALEDMQVQLPVIPGIMPITNGKQLIRFSDGCGAEIPRWLRLRLEAYGDDLDAIRDFGLDVVSDLCQQLLEAGAPGLHFYTLNKAEPTNTLWHNLGLPK